MRFVAFLENAKRFQMLRQILKFVVIKFRKLNGHFVRTFSTIYMIEA